MEGKKVIIILLVVILSTALLFACKPDRSTVGGGLGPGEKTEILVAAAASLTDVLGEIQDLYKTIEPQVSIKFTFAGSGALQSQIEEGAPVDIFMSAAQRQMEDLRKSGLILDDTIKSLLVNRLVLIRPKGSNLEISSFEDLGAPSVKRIAIGDPGNVPVGQYSEEIFKNLGLEDRVKSKLILANDVRTVLTWVENGEVDCGLVYATDAFTTDRVEIIGEAPKDSHQEVSYPVGLVRDSRYPAEARAFLDFLSTEEARALFKKYGFSIK